MVRNFYETSHGKSVCDGLGAIVKNSCYQAVLSRKEIIKNANDLFEFCQKKLKINGKFMIGKDGMKYFSKREFIFINENDVQRSNPDILGINWYSKISLCHEHQHPHEIAYKTPFMLLLWL